MKYSYLFRIQDEDGTDEMIERGTVDILPSTDDGTIIATIIRKHCDLLCPVMQEIFPAPTKMFVDAQEFGIVSGYVQVDGVGTAYVSASQE